MAFKTEPTSKKTFICPKHWEASRCLKSSHYITQHRHRHTHTHRQACRQAGARTRTRAQTINWQLLTPRLRPVWQTWFQAASAAERKRAEQTHAELLTCAQKCYRVGEEGGGKKKKKTTTNEEEMARTICWVHRHWAVRDPKQKLADRPAEEPLDWFQKSNLEKI